MGKTCLIDRDSHNIWCLYQDEKTIIAVQALPLLNEPGVTLCLQANLTTQYFNAYFLISPLPACRCS